MIDKKNKDLEDLISYKTNVFGIDIEFNEELASNHLFFNQGYDRYRRFMYENNLDVNNPLCKEEDENSFLKGKYSPFIQEFLSNLNKDLPNVYNDLQNFEDAETKSIAIKRWIDLANRRLPNEEDIDIYCSDIKSINDNYLHEEIFKKNPDFDKGINLGCSLFDKEKLLSEYERHSREFYRIGLKYESPLLIQHGKDEDSLMRESRESIEESYDNLIENFNYISRYFIQKCANTGYKEHDHYLGRNNKTRLGWKKKSRFY